MNAIKEQIIRVIEARARQEAGDLAGGFARAASADREDILAALELERWLAEACRDCWPMAERGPRRHF